MNRNKGTISTHCFLNANILDVAFFKKLETQTVTENNAHELNDTFILTVDKQDSMPAKYDHIITVQAFRQGTLGYVRVFLRKKKSDILDWINKNLIQDYVQECNRIIELYFWDL